MKRMLLILLLSGCVPTAQPSIKVNTKSYGDGVTIVEVNGHTYLRFTGSRNHDISVVHDPDCAKCKPSE